jgi:hypothetical protein
MATLPTVTLYGRRDCHLCDEAEEMLRRLHVQIGLPYRKVDILSSPELYQELRYRIPVIDVEGGATLDWPTTRGAIHRAALAAAAP